MSRVLITGATGFVGRALLPVLAGRHTARIAVRRPTSGIAAAVETLTVGEIGPETDWSAALEGVDQVVHLAAHVHQMKAGDDALYERVNAEGTRRLAEAAREAGIRQLIYLSSIKVNGEATVDHPFRADDRPVPVGPYARSKWAAEQALAKIAGDGGPATVILRPPLVYGPGAKANFGALVRLCRLGLPLPFGAVDNRRSLIYVGNLAAAIARVIGVPAQPGCRTYLVRDGEDLSTAELVRRLGAALGGRPRLVAIPAPWLRAALVLCGRSAIADRLLQSLTVDDGDFRRDFAWRPPYTVDEALAATAVSLR